jgi:hypothetical protein
MRRSLLLSAVVPVLCAPAAAGAAGFPIANVDTTKTGATAPGDPFRYVAFPARGETVLTKIKRANGSPVRTQRLHGRLVVAAVAQDASTTGLSADGSTLVLATPRRNFPERSTRLTVVDTASLRPVRSLRLRGDFALDGISPNGRRLYFIQYRDSPTDYAVRAYDVAHRRLLPKPIVDARNPDEKMTGFPVTRAVSADGRWAYTLYAGGEEPFVHALDMARTRAFCVDLPGLVPDALAAMHLIARRGHVDLITPAGDTVRRIDAATFKVTTPPVAIAPAPRHARQVQDEPPSDGFPWGLAGVVAAIAAAAAFLLRRRYAAGADSAASRAANSSTPTVP